jgi:peroxiredoxin
MLPLGTKAPDFRLKDPDGNTVSRDDYRDSRALLVVFMCNHCPFVKHIIKDFAALAREYGEKGVGIVAINSNDIEAYPDDSPENMAKLAKSLSFSFPYLYDEDQTVARAYRAACTPDFFLFDGDRKLVYRGQMDDSRPKKDIPITGKDLRAAMDAVLEDRKVPAEQKHSIGCNIKWKPGNEPDYFG